MDEIDANTDLLFVKLENWLNGLIKLLPNLAVAVVVLLVFWVIARLLSAVVRRAAQRRNRPSLADVGSSMVTWAVMIFGLMLSVTIVAPSITPATLLGSLGIGSVAIGFAFKDILQNMLAGILILLNQPFNVGDQIISGGHEGTVERIETRATLIKTYDGRRVVIPNTVIYTASVVVNTAFDKRRSEYDIGIGCSDDWDTARQIMQDACVRVDGVLRDPAPETIPMSLGDYANIVRLRWWTDPVRASQINTFGDVIQSVAKALDAAGIDMPYPTQVHLFHDQTEETDGIRGQQREGWPAGKGRVPAAARIGAAIAGSGGASGPSDADTDSPRPQAARGASSDATGALA